MVPKGDFAIDSIFFLVPQTIYRFKNFKEYKSFYLLKSIFCGLEPTMATFNNVFLLLLVYNTGSFKADLL